MFSRIPTSSRNTGHTLSRSVTFTKGSAEPSPANCGVYNLHAFKDQMTQLINNVPPTPPTMVDPGDIRIEILKSIKSKADPRKRGQPPEIIILASPKSVETLKSTKTDPPKRRQFTEAVNPTSSSKVLKTTAVSSSEPKLPETIAASSSEPKSNYHKPITVILLTVRDLPSRSPSALSTSKHPPRTKTPKRKLPSISNIEAGEESHTDSESSESDKDIISIPRELLPIGFGAKAQGSRAFLKRHGFDLED